MRSTESRWIGWSSSVNRRVRLPPPRRCNLCASRSSSKRGPSNRRWLPPEENTLNMRIRIPDSDSHIHLDFVPMVDTLFNLLIFFLLATTIRQVEREMNIALPHTSAALPMSVAMRELTINVDKDGHTFVSGKEIGSQPLRDMVAEAAK